MKASMRVSTTRFPELHGDWSEDVVEALLGGDSLMTDLIVARQALTIAALPPTWEALIAAAERHYSGGPVAPGRLLAFLRQSVHRL